jgi:hypothetical protein
VAPDWEKLATDFESNNEILIAEVDCTNDANDDICSDNGVQGFPTLKYGNPNALDDYDQGRDYASLKAFADENLKPSCSPFNLELCEGAEKARIEELSKKSLEELKAETTAVEEQLEKADDEFEEEVEKLQAEYMKMMEASEKKKEELKKSSNYKEIKSVLAFKQSQVKNDEL